MCVSKKLQGPQGDKCYTCTFIMQATINNMVNDPRIKQKARSVDISAVKVT